MQSDEIKKSPSNLIDILGRYNNLTFLIPIHFKKIFDIYILTKSEICVLINYIISLRMLMMNNKFEKLLHGVRKTSDTKRNLIQKRLCFGGMIFYTILSEN